MEMLKRGERERSKKYIEVRILNMDVQAKMDSTNMDVVCHFEMDMDKI